MNYDWKSGSSAGRAKTARILVVDDHPLVRLGLKQLIVSQPDLELCGEADSLLSAQKILAIRKLDLVTVDIRLQCWQGMELLKNLKMQHPDLPALVISQCGEAPYAERALKAGASGYVTEEAGTDEVLAAIRTVLAGGMYASPKIAALVRNEPPFAGQAGIPPLIGNLTDRELQLVQLFGAGLGTRQIAARLCLSIKTVETHRENIKRKLKLSSAAELVGFATNWVNGQSSHHFPGAASVPRSIQGNQAFKRA
jgi:DNA-binding NarL/FixJ family response regulator